MCVKERDRVREGGRSRSTGSLRGSSYLACKAVVKIPYMDIQNEISEWN